MNLFHGLSLPAKVRLVAVTTGGLALLAAGVMLLLYDWAASRHEMAERLELTTGIIGSACAASLTFDDPGTAEENLRALSIDQGILSAELLREDGKLFARFSREERTGPALGTDGTAELPPGPAVGALPSAPGSGLATSTFPADGHLYRVGELVVSRPVLLDGRRIGQIVTRSSLDAVWRRMKRDALAILLTLLLCAALALLLSARLQRPISTPILELVQAMERVSSRGDYALHLEKRANDEVGALVEGFNRMLAQIHARDQELLRHRDRLEDEVAQRTAELTAAKETAEANSRELEAFSYSVSHDLRAPLRAIDGFSRIVEEDYAPRLDDEGRQLLARVRAAVQQMDQLIGDLLQLARVARAELRREQVDLTALAREVEADLRRQLPDRPVQFTVGEGLLAMGDGHLLRLVLENLLGNAWKYTSRTAEPRIEFGSASVDGTEAFHVRDNGVGFDMTYAGKLFQPFQRMHARSDFPGSGVGLANVQRIVVRHAGRVWATSVAGQGATFYFTLPRPHNGGPQ